MPLLRHAIPARRRSAQGWRALNILVVAPSWVGDAILSEPLVAHLRSRHEGVRIDVLAPGWCAPVYARMRGIGRVIDSALRHGEVSWTIRRSLARTLSDAGYAQAILLPNSWKSALVPWLAHIPRRTGYLGEMRWGLLNDVRSLDRKKMPRLVDRYAALAGDLTAKAGDESASAPVLVPDTANRDAAVRGLDLALDRPVAILCPGAEFGPAKRWPAEHFASLARKLLAQGMQVWLLGSPKDKPAAAAVLAGLGDTSDTVRDLTGRTDLGTAIDLLSLAALVVSNDSGLMHAAAAVGARLVALFGSSSPVYTPPMSAVAAVARIDIACSPCFRRECPLGHFKCMRELAPDAVYDLARATLGSRDTAATPRPPDRRSTAK